MIYIYLYKIACSKLKKIGGQTLLNNEKISNLKLNIPV